MSLRNKTITGVFWAFINVFLTRGASFFATVILATILSPDDFGLLGMIAIFMGIGNTLIESGLSNSLIRSEKVDNEDFSTVFYTNVAISIFVYFLVFLGSKYIAVFYNQPVLTDIIRVYCIGFVVSATSAVQTTILVKNMEFKKLTYYQIPATIISIFIGFLLAYLGYGVWSMVWMFITNQVVRSITLWYKSMWTPTLTFNIEKLKRHFNFGYKLTLSSLLNTVFSNIYNILIGRYYAIETLGYFERSQTFKHYIVSTLTDVVAKVTYPMFSKIQNEKDKLVAIFKKTIIFVFFYIAPIMLGLSAVGKPLFLLVLGDKWAPAIPFFQILCVSGVLYPLHFLNINLLQVLGRSDLFLKIELIKKAALLLIVLIGFQYGVYGLALSTIVSSIIGFFINTFYTGVLIDYGAVKQLKDLFSFFITSIFMSIMMYLLVGLLINYPLFVQLLIPSIFGFCFYLSINYLFKSNPLFYTIEIIKNHKL